MLFASFVSVFAKILLCISLAKSAIIQQGDTRLIVVGVGRATSMPQIEIVSSEMSEAVVLDINSSDENASIYLYNIEVLQNDDSPPLPFWFETQPDVAVAAPEFLNGTDNGNAYISLLATIQQINIMFSSWNYTASQVGNCSITYSFSFESGSSDSLILLVNAKIPLIASFPTASFLNQDENPVYETKDFKWQGSFSFVMQGQEQQFPPGWVVPPCFSVQSNAEWEPCQIFFPLDSPAIYADIFPQARQSAVITRGIQIKVNASDCNDSGFLKVTLAVQNANASQANFPGIQWSTIGDLDEIFPNTWFECRAGTKICQKQNPVMTLFSTDGLSFWNEQRYSHEGNGSSYRMLFTGAIADVQRALSNVTFLSIGDSHLGSNVIRVEVSDVPSTYFYTIQVNKSWNVAGVEWWDWHATLEDAQLACNARPACYGFRRWDVTDAGDLAAVDSLLLQEFPAIVSEYQSLAGKLPNTLFYFAPGDVHDVEPHPANGVFYVRHADSRRCFAGGDEPQPATAYLDVRILPRINRAPQVNISRRTRQVQTGRTFALEGIDVVDPDYVNGVGYSPAAWDTGFLQPTGDVILTYSASLGNFSIIGSTEGLLLPFGDGVEDNPLYVIGLLPAIQALLPRIVMTTPAETRCHATACPTLETLQVSINDLGHSGYLGARTNALDVALDLRTGPYNIPPTFYWSGQSRSLALREDAVTDVSGISVSDPDINQPRWDKPLPQGVMRCVVTVDVASVPQLPGKGAAAPSNSSSAQNTTTAAASVNSHISNATATTAARTTSSTLPSTMAVSNGTVLTTSVSSSLTSVISMVSPVSNASTSTARATSTGLTSSSNQSLAVNTTGPTAARTTSSTSPSSVSVSNGTVATSSNGTSFTSIISAASTSSNASASTARPTSTMTLTGSSNQSLTVSTTGFSSTQTSKATSVVLTSSPSSTVLSTAFTSTSTTTSSHSSTVLSTAFGSTSTTASTLTATASSVIATAGTATAASPNISFGLLKNPCFPVCFTMSGLFLVRAQPSKPYSVLQVLEGGMQDSTYVVLEADLDTLQRLLSTIDLLAAPGTLGAQGSLRLDVSDLGNTGFVDDSGSDPPGTANLQLDWLVTYPPGTDTQSITRLAYEGPLKVYVSPNGQDTIDCGSTIAPCRTIQAGLDQSSSGMEVLLTPGRYSGPGNVRLDLRGKTIVLRSQYAPRHQSNTCDNQTVIDCAGAGPAFLIKVGLQQRLSDLCEESATVQGWGIPTAAAVEAATAVLGHSGPPRSTVCPPSQPAGPTLIGLTVHNCSGESGGGMNIKGDVVVQDCCFEQCSARLLGGAVFATAGNVRFNRCMFAAGRAAHGAGIAVRGGSVRLIGTKVFRNLAGLTGGAAWLGGGTLLMEDSLLSENFAQVQGGALYVSAGNLTLWRTRTESNQAGERDAGLHVKGGTAPILTLTQSPFRNNTVAAPVVVGPAAEDAGYFPTQARAGWDGKGIRYPRGGK